jgi:catechol 2,3-dioxygenase-like lactoylglutathione lyase family enzyme
VGAGLTIGLHPPSPKAATPGTRGVVGFGLETYEPIDEVAQQLRERGVRVGDEVIRFEAGNVSMLVDHDGLSTYIHEFPPFMLVGEDDADDSGEAGSDDSDEGDLIAGGHAIVYVSDLDAAINFYTKTLGLTLTNRFGDNIAFAEAGKLVLAIHPRTKRTPSPGERGSAILGLTVNEPIDRVVSRLTSRGVRFTGSIQSAGDKFAELADPDGNAIYLWRNRRPTTRRGARRASRQRHD